MTTSKKNSWLLIASISVFLCALAGFLYPTINQPKAEPQGLEIHQLHLPREYEEMKKHGGYPR
jgi:hypothetical protein